MPPPDRNQTEGGCQEIGSPDAIVDSFRCEWVHREEECTSKASRRRYGRYGMDSSYTTFESSSAPRRRYGRDGMDSSYTTFESSSAPRPLALQRARALQCEPIEVPADESVEEEIDSVEPWKSQTVVYGKHGA